MSRSTSFAKDLQYCLELIEENRLKLYRELKRLGEIELGKQKLDDEDSLLYITLSVGKLHDDLSIYPD